MSIKKNEVCVGISWLLLSISATAMGLSTHLWLGLLWAIYGNRDWPWLTEIYLSSSSWYWGIPLVSGAALYLYWRTGFLDRHCAYVQIALHAASIAILSFAPFAAMQPFLTTAWGMGGAI